MARIAYEDWNPRGASLDLIRLANAICVEYRAQGYDLTLRQLYYQFVARDYVPNTQRSYKNLGVVIDKARRAGYLDWDYIVDRTRNLRGWNHSQDVPAFVTEQSEDFHLDLWKDQDYTVEVWVEKEALAGVVSRVANERDVRYFSCRGYVSQSEIHAAAKRHELYEQIGRPVVVVHLGDHDPSGIDMSRDIQDRLRLFGASTDVRRIALNRDQIDTYAPPPNPAKLTDSRAEGYIREHGRSSWELDALEPSVITALIEAEVNQWVDLDRWDARHDEQTEGRERLDQVASHWEAVVDFLDNHESE